MQNQVLCLAFNAAKDELYSGSEDTAIKVWDAQHGRLVRKQEGHRSWVTDMLFALLVLTGPHCHRLDGSWPARTGQAKLPCLMPDQAVTSRQLQEKFMTPFACVAVALSCLISHIHVKFTAQQTIKLHHKSRQMHQH